MSTPSPAPIPAHEHVWTRCPDCPAGDGPCACSGVACCDQERAEIASELASPSPAPAPVGAPGWLAETAELIAEYEKQCAAAQATCEVPGHLVVGYDVAPAAYRLAARTPVLVAALEAVLAAAGRWEARSMGKPAANIFAQTRLGCADEIREAIEAALRDAQGGAGQ